MFTDINSLVFVCVWWIAIAEEVPRSCTQRRVFAEGKLKAIENVDISHPGLMTVSRRGVQHCRRNS